MIINAGMVYTIPPAMASPAEAAVCTMLFSKIDGFLKNFKIPMDKIAAGIEAEVSMPSFNAKNPLAIAKNIVINIAKKKARRENSGLVLEKLGM